MMDNHAVNSDYWSRLEAFKKTDADREAMVVEILTEFEKLKVKHAEQVKSLEDKARQYEQTASSNNFVVALIDGDGALFQDELYSSGKDGGAMAAQMLSSEIKRHLRTIYPEVNVAECSVLVYLVCNLQGLAATLYKAGIISNLNVLSAFGNAFGLAQPLFNLIDVGSGKERADHKIRETLRLFLPVSQCKHIFFGPCHDNGYLPVLEPLCRDPATASRITLIETRAREPGFADLRLQMLRMPQIFRSEDLNIYAPLVSSSMSLPQDHHTSPGSQITHNASTSIRTSPVLATRPTEPSSAAANIWTTVASTSSGSKTISIAPRNPDNRRYGLLNFLDQRIDLTLPRSDPSAESRFSQAVQANGNYCNNFYLRMCHNGKYCNFHHGSKLSSGEMLVLKHKARSLYCPRKSSCRDLDCINGHHCKYGKQCTAEYCQFHGTHDVDTEHAKHFFEDGTEEWLQSYLVKNKK